ncbi:hypothetical protein ACE2AJ_05150 [Aquihabitans daechungensis]|uniref:hypothetical protein n=1 Tax=Aquihabitans daechungensis TaxID=1052257 RepID=UPI003B9E1B1E
MTQTVDSAGRPVDAAGRPIVAEQVETRPTAASAGLRVFQIVSALAGAVLFVFGLIAVFQVDFGADLLDTSAEVGGFGFSAVSAIAAILLGGAILVSTLADQDRGGTAFVGLITIALGIAALVVEGQAESDLQVDNRSAGLFIVAGAVAFVCSLVPWWSRRRVTTVVR